MLRPCVPKNVEQAKVAIKSGIETSFCLKRKEAKKNKVPLLKNKVDINEEKQRLKLLRVAKF